MNHNWYTSKNQNHESGGQNQMQFGYPCQTQKTNLGNFNYCNSEIQGNEKIAANQMNIPVNSTNTYSGLNSDFSFKSNVKGNIGSNFYGNNQGSNVQQNAYLQPQIEPNFANVLYHPPPVISSNVWNINIYNGSNAWDQSATNLVPSHPGGYNHNIANQQSFTYNPMSMPESHGNQPLNDMMKKNSPYFFNQNSHSYQMPFVPYGQDCSKITNPSSDANKKLNSSYGNKLENCSNQKSVPKGECHRKASNDSRKRQGSHATNRRSRSRGRRERSRSQSSNRRNRSRSRDRRRRRSRSRSRSRSISSRSRRGYSRSRSRTRNKSYAGSSRSRFRSRSRSRQRHRSRSLSRTYNRRERPTEKEGSFTEVSQGSETERQKLIEKWRMNNCNTQDEMQRHLQEISEMNPDEILEEETKIWIRSAPADCYYERDKNDLRRMRSTPKLDKLCERFRYELVERGKRVRDSQTLTCPPPIKPKQKLCKHKSQACSSSNDSESENSDESDDVNEMIEELQRKQKHPYRLHRELWYNDPGEMNDGPLCRCSAKARRSGIRHGFYAGENQSTFCDVKSNNAGDLYHYRITISPPTNFLTRTPTIINYDDHEFIFEGFSLISHYPIQKLPTCKVIRFNIEYIILYVEESLPENFSIQELDLFYNFLFKEILELVDFDLSNSNAPESCPQFHFMPRFVRELPEKGRELLPMCEVLKYFLESNKKLIEEDALSEIHKMSASEWQNLADSVKGMVVTNPGMKPCSLRVDQLDRDTDEAIQKMNTNKYPTSRLCHGKRSDSLDRSTREKDSQESDSKMRGKNDSPCSVSHCSDDLDQKQTSEKGSASATDELYPEIVHFGIRPPQLSYAGNPEYQKAWRKYVKFRHLLANMPKPTAEDKQKLAAKENCLHSMRAHNKMKRDVTVTVSSNGFYLTGLMCDVVQHAMLIPVLVCHLRFHRSLAVLEEKIGYKFKNRFLLQLALTHPSYREMLGINTLISIMSRFGKKNETQSNIYHNERLEFLGDAVVEFITSIHLFHIFRNLEEGGLATYRAALVQNQHLSVLAKKLHLDEFMLYAHGSDLCHDLELKHAMANCFEALMGALFLDGGIESANKVFGNTLYGDDEDCLDVWFNYPPHPLQEQEPLGDRKWIPQFTLLQNLTEFEEATGIEFKHIRLLARAFTDRSVGYTNLTLGSNQRLEFLGDSVLQLIASEYLYKYFPEHHEGHLSLLRSSLVNNKTQSVVCDDLGMTKYAVYANPKVELKIKDRADLLEAFLGALYVDNGLDICRVFCDVCFFPRLQIFIMNQDWNDPKSKLQQCCLTLRTMDNVEPDIPIYKVVECKGPTNTRVYTVAVYFRNKRLAKATGHSIQQAEMNAAQKAMEVSGRK
ncbi:hypothetical protein RUM44_006589 [Polyplax serrata]|uniref:Drosha n=1 Tax=Polyplax serrata TaxID=468196 RepID=A0ABR1AII7_POLSC